MTRISEEYAAALYALAAEENCKAETAEAVKTVRALLEAYPDYVELLAAPTVPADERCAVIDEALGSLQEYTVSFVKIMCRNGHARDIVETMDEFIKLYEYADGVVTAQIVSAAPLTAEQTDELQKKLEAKLSRRVMLSLSVDESLLGGMIVTVDGSIMDGSLRTKLAQMKNAISE